MPAATAVLFFVPQEYQIFWYLLSFFTNIIAYAALPSFVESVHFCPKRWSSSFKHIVNFDKDYALVDNTLGGGNAVLNPRFELVTHLCTYPVDFENDPCFRKRRPTNV